MKKLTLKLVLPLTIISFILYTKWWYVEVIDGDNTLLYGFPYPFMTNGPTSLSFVFFIKEFFVDFLVYFLSWFVFVFFIHKFAKKITVKKVPAILLWIVTILLMVFVFGITPKDANIYYTKMPKTYRYKVVETEFNFIGNNQRRAYFHNYLDEKQ